ncbi:MAG TPA: hypothetical protein VIY51_28520, partial [Xanthobacteraceae bacterium]
NGSGGCELYQPTTVCASVCASGGATLTQNFCDGAGNCNPAGVVTMCGTNTCSVGPPAVCD